LLPRERRELYLQALGHSYREITTLTDSTLTVVNRRLSERRAKLRRLGSQTRRHVQPPADADRSRRSQAVVVFGTKFRDQFLFASPRGTGGNLGFPGVL
jgi:hypothetical protein